ncbi:MAG: hypothetical protein WB772_00030 [Xanthobacteraceae bacterium]|jgi:hypothetical protein
MRFLSWLAALMIGATLFTTSAMAQSPFYCERHFYNDSNVTWTLDGAGVRRTFPPHSAQSLNFIGPALLQLRIISPFYDQTFDETYCFIYHSGNTGYVALNDPADADITTCGNPGFSCPSLRRHQRKKR